MNWKPRVATTADIAQLEALIPRSAFELQKAVYSQEQIAAAMDCVFGVDEQLINDGTYFVVESKGAIVGCGGWSFHKSLFGGTSYRKENEPRLIPEKDAARVRAFFVDPEYARQGIGSVIMKACEDAIRAMGFRRVEIAATLIGEPLYAKFGYVRIERFEIPLEGAPAMSSIRMEKRLDWTQDFRYTKKPS